MTVREYAKVLPSFWTGTTGRKIRALGPDAQVIALYLVTSPHASAIGLYHLPLAYVCADTGSPLEGALKALRSLSEVSFCHYDEDSETVWVPEMARHQVGESVKASDNRRPWLVKEAERMRKRPYFNDFLSKYGAAFNLGIEPDPKPLGSPLEAPSKPLRSQEQEREQEKEQEREQEAESRAGARETPQPAPATSGPMERFALSLEPVTDAERDVVRMISETRQEAGGAPWVATAHSDRDTALRLAKWAAHASIGPNRLREALGAFWRAKGTGARLSWMTDEDPGRWLGKVSPKTRQHRPAKPNEEYSTDLTDLDRWGL